MSYTTPNYPTFSSGTFSINGTPVATTSYNNGSTKSNYFLSPAQKQAYDYTQTAFAQYLPQINTFLPETIANLNSQVEAYKNKGIQSINEIYNPMLQSMQNNVATRFGNLDNSMFMDNLNKIESQRANAVNLLAQDINAKQDELMNNELLKQYDFLNFLNNYQNQTMNNAINATRISQNNASNSNQYQNQLYNSMLQQNKNSQNTLNNILPYLTMML